MPSVMKCKTTNSKSNAVKDNVKDQANEMVVDADFGKGIDDSKGKEDPGQDHDSTSGTRAKGVQGQDGQEQQGILKQDFMGSSQTVGHGSMESLPFGLFGTSSLTFNPTANSCLWVLMCRNSGSSACLGGGSGRLIDMIMAKGMTKEVRETPEHPERKEGNPGGSDIGISDKVTNASLLLVVIHD